MEKTLLNEIHGHILSYYRENYAYLRFGEVEKKKNVDKIIENKAIKMAYVFNQVLAQEFKINMENEASKLLNSHLYIYGVKKKSDDVLESEIKKAEYYFNMPFEDEVKTRLMNKEYKENNILIKPFPVNISKNSNHYKLLGTVKVKPISYSLAMKEFFENYFGEMDEENNMIIKNNIKNVRQMVLFLDSYRNFAIDFFERNGKVFDVNEFKNAFPELIGEKQQKRFEGLTQYVLKEHMGDRFYKRAVEINHQILNAKKSDFVSFESDNLLTGEVSVFWSFLVKEYFDKLKLTEMPILDRMKLLNNMSNGVAWILNNNVDLFNYENYLSSIEKFENENNEKMNFILSKEHYEGIFQDDASVEKIFDKFIVRIESFLYFKDIQNTKIHSLIVDLKEEDFELLDKIRNSLKEKYTFLYEGKDVLLEENDIKYRILLSNDLDLKEVQRDNVDLVRVLNTRLTLYEDDDNFDEYCENDDNKYCVKRNGDDKNIDDWIKHGWSDFNQLGFIQNDIDFMFPYLKADKTAYYDFLEALEYYNDFGFIYTSPKSREIKEYRVLLNTYSNGLKSYQLSAVIEEGQPNFLTIETSCSKFKNSGLSHGAYQMLSDFAYENNMILLRNINDFTFEGSKMLKDRSRLIREENPNHLILDYYERAKNYCLDYQATPFPNIEELNNIQSLFCDLMSNNKTEKEINEMVNQNFIKEIKEKTQNNEYQFIDVNFNNLFVNEVQEIMNRKMDNKEFAELVKTYHQYYNVYKNKYLEKHEDFMNLLNIVFENKNSVDVKIKEHPFFQVAESFLKHNDIKTKKNLFEEHYHYKHHEKIKEEMKADLQRDLRHILNPNKPKIKNNRKMKQ